MKITVGLKLMFQVISPSELVHQGSVIGLIDLTGDFGLTVCPSLCLLLVNYQCDSH